MAWPAQVVWCWDTVLHLLCCRRWQQREEAPTRVRPVVVQLIVREHCSTFQSLTMNKEQSSEQRTCDEFQEHSDEAVKQHTGGFDSNILDAHPAQCCS